MPVPSGTAGQNFLHQIRAWLLRGMHGSGHRVQRPQVVLPASHQLRHLGAAARESKAGKRKIERKKQLARIPVRGGMRQREAVRPPRRARGASVNVLESAHFHHSGENLNPVKNKPLATRFSPGRRPATGKICRHRGVAPLQRSRQPVIHWGEKP